MGWGLLEKMRHWEGHVCVCGGVCVCSHTFSHPREQDPAVGHLNKHPRQAQRKGQRSL